MLQSGADESCQSAEEYSRRRDHHKTISAKGIDRASEQEIRPKILVAASKGGHWEQVMRLRDTFDPYDVTYVTTDPLLSHKQSGSRTLIVPDCNRDTPLLMFSSIRACFRAVLQTRPDYVLSTGALPGLFCILAGRAIGAETIWIDSFANAERLSMCGTIAQRVATTCLTQWEHLASQSGPTYVGSIL